MVSSMEGNVGDDKMWDDNVISNVLKTELDVESKKLPVHDSVVELIVKPRSN